MKILVEPIYKTNQLLVRLLGNDVQTGSYILDATPAIPEIKSFEVFAGMVRQDEARLYFTGFAKFPDNVKVTLPDSTQQTIALVEVILLENQDVIEQSKETITKEEKPVFQAPKEIETIAPPEVPRLWVELALERTTPLTLGQYIASTPLTYEGGTEGRALTNEVAQPALNVAPYLVGVPPRFEGAWSNNLTNCDFSLKEKRAFLVDLAPVGWGLDLANPNDMLRLQISEANPLPQLTITWRAQESDRSAINVQPRLAITTPDVSEGRAFQAIVSPHAKNDHGWVRLQSYNGLYASPNFSLEAGVPRTIRLDVQDDPGPVTIVWHQRCFLRENQVLALVAPVATTYASTHTWGPIGSSAADLLHIPSIVYENRKWPFTQGYVRLDSDVEDRLEPLSWSIKSTLGPTLLQVEEGLLSSSFASASLLLSNYLPSDVSEAGNYKIKWSSEGVRLISRTQPGGMALPFAFDLAMPQSIKEAPLALQVKSFAPNRGSGVLRYFGFFPK